MNAILQPPPHIQEYLNDPKNFKPWAKIKFPSPRDLNEAIDRAELARANRLAHKLGAIQNSGHGTQTYGETFYINHADFNAFNTSNVEGSILAGLNTQPWIPAFFFLTPDTGRGHAVRFAAKGVGGSTSAPTITFQTRLGSTAGSASLSGSSVGVTSAITMGTTVTNKYWELWLDLKCDTPGIGTNNCTLSGAGCVFSPGLFSTANGTFALEPTTPDTATWTATIDGGVTNYFNLSVVFSVSNAANTITCKWLQGYSYN
jgi:hypothetical protein